MSRLIGLIAVAAAAGVGRAAEPTETITVTASATVYSKPNAARVHYTVRVTEGTVDAAKDSAAKQAAAVTTSLKELKLDGLATTLGAVSYSRRTVQPGGRGFGGPGAFNPGANPAPPPGPQNGFYGSIPLTTTLRESDPDKLYAAADALLRKLNDAGIDVTGDGVDADVPAPWVSSRTMSVPPRVDWLLTDDTGPRQDAFRAAVRKAKANAEAISKEIGWETVKVLSVEGATVPRELADGSTSTSRTPAGEVAVTARVTLKCSR